MLNLGRKTSKSWVYVAQNLISRVEMPPLNLRICKQPEVEPDQPRVSFLRRRRMVDAAAAAETPEVDSSSSSFRETAPTSSTESSGSRSRRRPRPRRPSRADRGSRCLTASCQGHGCPQGELAGIWKVLPFFLFRKWNRRGQSATIGALFFLSHLTEEGQLIWSK